MKIERQGSKINYGSKAIEFSSDRVIYSSDSKSIHLKANGVRDFNNKGTQHNYAINIDKDDLIAIFEAIAVSAIENPDALEATFSNALKPILQIGYVVSGQYKVSKS